MAIFAPDASIQIARPSVVYGWPVQEPLVISSLSSQWHDEAGTSVDGRYHKASGETHGTPIVARKNTYLTGNALLTGTGKAFAVVSGSWVDTAFHPKFHTNCLSAYDGSPSTSNGGSATPPVAEVVASGTAPSDIEHAEIWLQWSEPPVGVSGNGSDVAHDRNTRYTYVHLAYQSPDGQDYRIAFCYGQPIRLDVRYGANATNATAFSAPLPGQPVPQGPGEGDPDWQIGVAVLKDLGNFERYLANNNNQVQMRITPSLGYEIIGVEIGDGNFLTHKPDKAQLNPPKHITSFNDSDHLLPRNGKIRIVHRNGTLRFSYFPGRFQDLVVQKSTVDYGDKIKDASGAFLQVNSLLPVDGAQTNTGSVMSDGGNLSWKLSATKDDAGDGMGSATPSRFSDVSIVIPAKWDTLIPGQPANFDTEVKDLLAYEVDEIEVWDDVARLATSRATITANNHFGEWNSLFGNLAINIQASNGGAYYQRLAGVVAASDGGISFSRHDPTRTLTLKASDKSRMMQRALDEERIFDGWCIYSVVRYLCEKGGIHPSFLLNIPLYIPPGATAAAPYGPAGYDCPYYSLPRGTGLQPYMRFYPTAIIWQILQQLVQFMSIIDPGTGFPVPFFMGFDASGQFHFEPVALYNLPISMAYSSIDPSGQGLIDGELQIVNDVADMRTSIDFQGIDAQSYELLIEHREQNWDVQLVQGWRNPWLERSAAFCSGDYIKYAADVSQFLSAIPKQTVTFRAPFQPFLHAGAKISVTDPMLGGTQLYSITRLQSRYGYRMDGMGQCSSVITARSIASTY